MPCCCLCLLALSWPLDLSAAESEAPDGDAATEQAGTTSGAGAGPEQAESGSSEEAAPAAAVGAELQRRAEAFIAEVEAGSESGDSGLSKDDVLLLRGIEFDLLEAERWLERGDATFAGEAFLRARATRAALGEAQVARYGDRLRGIDRRMVGIARRLLTDLPQEQPAADPASEQPPSDSEAPSQDE